MENKILTKRQKRIEIEQGLRLYIKTDLLPRLLNEIDCHLENVAHKRPYSEMEKGDVTIKNLILNKHIKSEENFNSFVSWFEAIIDRPMTDEEKQRARNKSITKF